MDAKLYLEILRGPVRRSLNSLFPDDDGIFQQDNDPKHPAHVCRDYLDAKGIECLTWPGQSPDLNPIENLWAHLDTICRDRNSLPKTKAELFELLRQGWNNINIEVLQNFSDSMPHRIEEVIKRRGYHSHYQLSICRYTDMI